MISDYTFDYSKDGRISDFLIESARFSSVLKKTTTSEKIGITDLQILLLLMEKGPLSLVQISHLLCKPGSNLISPIKKLETGKYVYSEFKNGCRSKVVSLTGKGLEYALSLMEKARRTHNNLFKYSL